MLSEDLARALYEKDIEIGRTPRKDRSVWQKVLGRDKEDTWKVSLFTGGGDYESNPSFHFYRNGDDLGYISVFRDRTVSVARFKGGVPPDLMSQALDMLAKQNEAIRRALPTLRRELKLTAGGGGAPYR